MKTRPLSAGFLVCVIIKQMIELFVFSLGAIVGSFLNVVALRYNSGRSVIRGRSRCFTCGTPLSWRQLIPIFSFFAQRGKCGKCESKISWQYPIIEVLTGLMFLFVFLFWGGNGTAFGREFPWLFLGRLVYYWAVFSLLIVIALYDFRHQIIPDVFVYSFAFLSFAAIFFETGQLWPGLMNRFLSGIAFFSFFALVWFLSDGKGMGFGDAKLALGIGFLLGPIKGLVAILIGFWSGAIAGLLLLILAKKRYNMKSRVAFGPFLIFGTMVAFWFGDAIIGLYI